MIGRKAILAFGVNFLKNAIGYVGLFFVARCMGPETFGALSYGFAYVGLFHFIADMGFGVAHIKKISEGRDLPACLGTYLVLRTVTTLLMAAAVVGSLILQRYWHNGPGEGGTHELIILIAVATFVLLDLAQIPSGTFAARKETAKQMIPDLVGKTLETALKIVIALVGLGVVLLAGASLVGALAGLVLYGLLFKSYSIGRPTWPMAKEYIFFALPVMVIVSANAITENLDQIMIQTFWSSGELGYYAGAAKITTILMFSGTAVGTLVFPTISAMHAAKDLAGIRTLTHRAERFTSIVLFPLGVLLTFNNEFVVRLILGRGFDGSSSIVSILAWSSIVSVVSVPYFTQIIGTGRTVLSAVLSVTLMSLSVALNLVFIPVALFGIPLLGLGASGAALASLLAAVIMGTLCRACAYRATATGMNLGFLKNALAACLMILAMNGFAGIVGRSLTLDLGTGVIGLAVYIGVLALLGGELKEDLAYLFNAGSPGKMRSYIMGEFRSPQLVLEKTR